MNKSQAITILTRYIALVLLALGNLAIFYKIFTPLTIYSAYITLAKLYGAQLIFDNTIHLNGYMAAIVPACVAGAAYYFLLILNLTTPMPLLKRLKTILFSLLAFYLINTARIILFAILFFKGFKFFDLTHTLSWYFGSTILVIAIWFLTIWLFKIQNIPIYTDFKNMFSDIKP